MTDLNMEQNDHCKLCSEICHFADDTIVICQSCLSMFHVVCLERQHLMRNGHMDSDQIRCCTCHPSSSSSSSSIAISDELQKQENLMIKLAKMRRQILLSSNANHCLEHILKVIVNIFHSQQLLMNILHLEKTNEKGKTYR